MPGTSPGKTKWREHMGVVLGRRRRTLFVLAGLVPATHYFSPIQWDLHHGKAHESVVAPIQSNSDVTSPDARLQRVITRAWMRAKTGR